MVALAGCLSAVSAAGGQGQSVAEEASGERVLAAPLRPRTVVVVPFTNISGEPADDWMASGIAETVTADLDQFPALSVVGRAAIGATGRFDVGAGAPDEDTALDVARELGVSWMVAGGFQRLGQQLRITARIVSVETGAATRAIKVDGETEDLFALQDRIVDELRDGFAEIAGTSLAGRLVIPDRPVETPPEPAILPPLAAEPAVQGLPGGVAPEDVTGGIAIGDDRPQFGVASGVGVLTGRQTVRPPRAQVAPSIDGRLDDAVWADAVHITEFVQLAPLDGAPGTEDTDVYIAYDSANIYLGFHAHYSDPSILRASRTDRDQARGDDAFSVYFDPFLDQQRAYVFTVNAYGVQTDAILSSRGGGGFGSGRGGPRGFFGPPHGDSSWDALFDSAGQRVPDGFTAEMAIPFKSLRYPRRGGNTPHRWGFQIARWIRGRNETVVWSRVSRDIAGFLPQMGVLDGMTGLSTSRNFEILPTFTAVKFGSLDHANGSFVDLDTEPEGGINFKYGVTSNLTADLTFNPDFSQIESDRPQIEVNQRFALFFPELRPFFLEGAEIFQFRGPVNLVHTRTIVDPRYGAKLTGKAGNTTIGVMYANDEAPGDVEDGEDPAFGQTAQTFVGRMRYDLYSESYVGAIFTAREFLDSHNRVGGIDSNFRLGDTYSFGVRAVGTRDRDLAGVDTTGYLLDASFRKTGRNLSYGLATYALSPDFKTEVGFVRRTDQRSTFSELSYRWWPESWIISWGPQVRYSRSYNFDGVLEDQVAGTGLNFSLSDNIRLDANVNRDMERFGGIDFFKTRYRFMGVVSASRRFSFGLGSHGGDQIFFDEDNPYLGHETGWNGFLNLRLIPRLQSRININTNRFVDVRSNDALVFDVSIFRTLTTYQFTDRLLFRNISEYNSFDHRLGLNFLFTYRVNAGTVFYVGYDDHYQQADQIERDLNGDGIDDRFFQSTALKQTNRAIFMKFQYLFRY